MNALVTNMKDALLVCAVELAVFFLSFLLVEFLYLNKGVGGGVKAAMVSTFIRILYLQVFAQFIALSVLFYFTKNIYVLFFVMIVMFFSYYSFLRGEMVPLEKLFGFGLYGNTTPSFLVFCISSFITVFLFKQFRFWS